MPGSSTPIRKLKPMVTDLNGLATLLNSDRSAVLQALHEGKLPSPQVVCGEEVWLISEINNWLKAGSPDRATWELKKTAPKAKPVRKPIPRQALIPFDNFQIPRSGKSVFAWVKRMESTFGEKLIDGMTRDGESLGWGGRFASWDQQQVNAICGKVIDYLRDLPSYRGEFDHLLKAQSREPPWKAG